MGGVQHEFFQIMNSEIIVAGHSHGQGRPLELGSGLIRQSGAAWHKVAQDGTKWQILHFKR